MHEKHLIMLIHCAHLFLVLSEPRERLFRHHGISEQFLGESFLELVGVVQDSAIISHVIPYVKAVYKFCNTFPHHVIRFFGGQVDLESFQRVQIAHIVVG